jgi:TatD DNase family protein
MKYFDAHCHVQFPQYDADREEVLWQMAEAEIGGLVVGCDAASSKASCELTRERDGLWSSVGLHPNHAEDEGFDEHLMRNLLMYPKAVAIGECGLDYFRPAEVTDAVKKKQKEVFERHMHLAGKTRRTLMIHGRPTKGTMDAYDDIIDILAAGKREYGDALKANIHFFVGNVDIAKKFYELDATTSYTAVITFARNYDETLRHAPLDRLLTETDAPYIAPASRRGQRNDPLSIPEIVAKMAEIRGEETESVRAAVLGNAERQFGPF